MSQSPNRGQRVARNVLFNVVSQVWLTLVVIVTIPIVLHALGAAAYGVFVLASLVLGYTALLDLGLTPAVVRSIAVHSATGDRAELERIIGTALTLLTALAVIGSVTLALLTPLAVTSLLHLPASLRSDARFVLYVACFGFACNMVLLLFVAIAQGLQRLDLFAGRTLVLGTITGVTQVVVVQAGGGLRGLGLVTILINVLSLLVFVLVAVRLLPGVAIRPRLDRAAVRELLGFGSMKFLNQAAVQIIFHVDRLIVGAFLPIAAVSYYGVPVSICQKFVLVQQAVNQAFFPAASELHALRDAERLRQLYVSATKLGLTALLPITVIATLLANPLLSAWIGPAFGNASAPILQVLAPAYAIIAVGSVAGFAADATGHPDWNAAFTVGSAIVNLALALFLVPRIGAVGAAYALLINGILLLILMNFAVQHWLIRLPFLPSARRIVARPLLAGCGLAAYTLLVASRARGLLPLVAAALLGMLIYAGLTVVVGVWDEREKAIGRGLLRAGLARFRTPPRIPA